MISAGVSCSPLAVREQLPGARVAWVWRCSRTCETRKHSDSKIQWRDRRRGTVLAVTLEKRGAGGGLGNGGKKESLVVSSVKIASAKLGSLGAAGGSALGPALRAGRATVCCRQPGSYLRNSGSPTASFHFILPLCILSKLAVSTCATLLESPWVSHGGSR